MNRRGFLTRSGLALGALIVGDEVLETLDRLNHRKVFALGGIPMAPRVEFAIEKSWDWEHIWHATARVTSPAGVQVFDIPYTIPRVSGFVTSRRQHNTYHIVKAAQMVERSYGIPVDDMIPAMERALA